MEIRQASEFKPLRCFVGVIGVVLVVAGCSERDPEVTVPVESALEGRVDLASGGAAVPLAGAPNRAGIPTSGAPPSSEDTPSAGSTELADAGDRVAAEAESDKDYWRSIPFDRSNFDEVRKFVKDRYIEAKVDTGRAYAEAAGFVLTSDEGSEHIILPESFYKDRKDNPEEKGRLSGKLTKLKASDSFVILGAVEAKEEDRVLSDDEIAKLREQQRARAHSLDVAWKKARFGESDFLRVMDHVATHFGRGKDSKWSMKRAWIAAAQGYLYALDPHSSLIPKEAWEASTREVTDSSFEGIGAILTRRPDSEYTIVETPIPGQPAVKAGLRAGDRIVKVDGADIKGELLSKVVSRIRGHKGTKVVLTVMREGHPAPLSIGIMRSHIEIRNVQGRLIKQADDIGYVKLTGFVPTTDRELGRTVERLRSKTQTGRLKGLVLDLRNNSGGLLKEGIKVADRFLKSGIVVTVKNRHEADEVHRATPDATWEMPVVVLVNDAAASASEIVASAIQENGRGLVMGDRTFGKASVQTLFSPLYRDEYYIKLTVARYYSPTGRTLQVLGVKPDIETPEEIGGKMPLGFREENLSRHLSPLSTSFPAINGTWTSQLKACEKANGKAEAIHKADPNPAVKFDFQMYRAVDILSCMASHPRPPR